MAVVTAPEPGVPNVQVVRRTLTLGALVFIVFFTVSGGALRAASTSGRGADVEKLYADGWARVQDS